MKHYKKVLIEIEVPCGNYCYRSDRVCEHFSFRDEFPKCALRLGSLKYDKDGIVRKPSKCKELRKVSVFG